MVDRKIKLVVFDLDGTIADSKGLYVNTMKDVLEVHSLHFTKYQISNSMGPKTRQTIANLTGLPSDKVNQLRNEINPRVEKGASKLKLCPYTKGVLHKLKKEKFPIILMTNSTHQYLETALKKNKILHLFDEVLGAEDFLKKETAFHTLFSKYKVRPEETLYVGDRRSDFEVAREAGCKILLIKSKSWDKTEISINKEYRKFAVNDLRGVLSQIRSLESKD